MNGEALNSVLESLLRLPREQATVEFKSNWEHADDIGQYISALANAAALLLGKLPDVLTASQKANKVKNLLQSMRRMGLIHPLGARSATVWFAGSALDK